MKSSPNKVTFLVFNNAEGHRVIIHRCGEMEFTAMLDHPVKGVKVLPPSFILNKLITLRTIFDILERRLKTNGVEVRIYGPVVA